MRRALSRGMWEAGTLPVVGSENSAVGVGGIDARGKLSAVILPQTNAKEHPAGLSLCFGKL